MHDYLVTAKSDDALEAAADALRRACGIADDDCCPDVLRLLAECGRFEKGPLRGFAFFVLPDTEMSDVVAAATCNPPQVYMRQSVMDGLKQGRPSDRIIVTHEIMHIVLGHEGVPKNRMIGGNTVVPFIPKSRSAERQATLAAMAFLMPTKLVQQRATVSELVREFGVTRRAAEVRFEQARRQGPRESPSFVADFLSNSRPNSISRIAQKPKDLHQKWQSKFDEAWNRLEQIANEDPDEYRKANGFAIRKSHRFNSRSHYGWTFEDDQIIAFQDLLTR
jgi:hypothetical protein